MKYFLIGCIVWFSGCSVKEYQMFNNEDPAYINSSQDINISYDSKVMPDDILTIDVYNMNQKSNILGTEGAKEESNQYIVSADGTIYLPLLKEVYVQGFTVKNLSKKFTEMYGTYLKQPYAKVAIKNHKIYVLGEVNKQGVVPMLGNAISVIEAIATSGGLTDHAVRNRIHVVSKEGGKHKIRTLDMSKLSTLNIDNIMLKHNSIVYVEPRAGKAIKVGIQDYLPVLQLISNLASTYLAIDYISNGK